MNRLYSLRKVEGMRKKPSTSEFLDWLVVLARAGVSPDEITRRFPYLGVLLKQEQDIDLLERRKRRGY